MRESETNAAVTTATGGGVVAAERLADWSSMAAGAFSVNTLRAWRADWESRGVTVADLRAVVNPSLETAGKTSCFSRRGDHPPLPRSMRVRRDAHESTVAGVIGNSKIARADHL